MRNLFYLRAFIQVYFKSKLLTLSPKIGKFNLFFWMWSLTYSPHKHGMDLNSWLDFHFHVKKIPFTILLSSLFFRNWWLGHLCLSGPWVGNKRLALSSFIFCVFADIGHTSKSLLVVIFRVPMRNAMLPQFGLPRLPILSMEATLRKSGADF